MSSFLAINVTPLRAIAPGGRHIKRLTMQAELSVHGDCNSPNFGATSGAAWDSAAIHSRPNHGARHETLAGRRPALRPPMCDVILVGVAVRIHRNRKIMRSMSPSVWGHQLTLPRADRSCRVTVHEQYVVGHPRISELN